MDEHGGPQRTRRGQDGLQPRVVQVAIRDVRADLDPGEPELTDAPLQFGDREIRVLERDRAKAGEPVRSIGDDPCQVIVEQARDSGCVDGRLVVREHDRHGGQDLEAHAGAIAILEPPGRVPAVVAHLAEDSLVDHDARAPRTERLQLRPAPVPEARPEVRPRRREDVGVDVDAIERHSDSGLR